MRLICREVAISVTLRFRKSRSPGLASDLQDARSTGGPLNSPAYADLSAGISAGSGLCSDKTKMTESNAVLRAVQVGTAILVSVFALLPGYAEIQYLVTRNLPEKYSDSLWLGFGIMFSGF